MGFVHVLDEERIAVPKKRLSENEMQGEIQRFEKALEFCRMQLEDIRQRLSDEHGNEHVYLIEAQILMLEDPNMKDHTMDIIREENINAEWALHRAIEHFRKAFDDFDDEYFRDRRSDIEYVEERLLRALQGSRETGYVSIQKRTILVAFDLSPADLVRMNRENIIAIVTDVGGRTSHCAILARSFGIPMLVGVSEATLHCKTGDRMIVDGMEGKVWIQPEGQLWTDYSEKYERYVSNRKELLKNRHYKAETKDHYHIHLYANVDFQDEIHVAQENGAEGIGMLRTEHVFLGNEVPVSEEKQYSVYREAVQRSHPNEVVVRMLDLSGDILYQPPGATRSPLNPALGLRGMRLLLREEEIFKTQARAILRASAEGKMAILFPMVTSVAELRVANRWLEDVKSELKKTSIPYDEEIRVGSMIEVPAAAFMADDLAMEVDFFSIGTNDLVQYILATDRDSSIMSYMYEPLHPAVLRTLQKIVDVAHKAGIEVGICGEMAAEPFFAPILVALEINFLSVHASAIPYVKQVIRDLSTDEARSTYQAVLQASDPRQAREELWDWYKNRFLSP